MYRLLKAEALEVRSTPYGNVGTVFSGTGMEVVWVSKQDEPIDPDCFVSDGPDVLVVLQGCLKVEFESSDEEDRLLSVGDSLVLPAGCRCRAFRWPRDSREATVFLAAYPVAGVAAD